MRLLSSIITIGIALSGATNAICTAATRIAGAVAVPVAYNATTPGETAALFLDVPFGPDCIITIAPDGLPGLPVSVDYTTSYDFVVLTRQVFSNVHARDFINFPDNGTTLIPTNVISYYYHQHKSCL